MAKIKLVVFDMDGTLLKGSACLEISRIVGALEETLLIEDDWSRGEISDNGFWVRCLPLWSGITDDQINQAFLRSPWLDGVKKTLSDIKSRGEYSIVISQSPKFFVDRLKNWGLDYSHGALVQPGNVDGAEQLVSSEDKLTITDKLISTLGLSRERCIAYGDSSSDLTLFQTLPNSIAVNAKEEIKNLAKIVYSGPSIWDAYKAARELVLDRDVYEGDMP